MPTKIFDTVNYYDTPVTDEAINATAAEMLQIDLAIIAAEVTVTFPVGTVAGQAIGILCAGEDGANGIFGAGPVTSFGFSLSRAGDCALFTWDPDYPGGAQWVLVQQWHEPQAATLQWLTPSASTTPSNGDFAIDSGSQIILLPDAPANGSFVGVKSTNGSTTVQAQGTDSIDGGDGTSGATYLLPYEGAAAIFVYDGGTWWMPASFSRVAALKPTQDTGTAFTPGLSDIGYLIEFTDGGTVTVTVPAQGGGVGEVEWPNWASFDFAAAGGDLTVVGDAGVDIKVPQGKDPTSRGTWARMRLERLVNTNEWLLSGDLLDSGP